MASTTNVVRITYPDGTHGWVQTLAADRMMAKRELGKDADEEDRRHYAAYNAAVRNGLPHTEGGYEKWLLQIAAVTPVPEDEDLEMMGANPDMSEAETAVAHDLREAMLAEYQAAMPGEPTATRAWSPPSPCEPDSLSETS